MTTPAKYTHHPLLPLMQLLESIDSATEFKARQVEILDAIHLAAPILKDRTPECCKLAKEPFLKRQGSPSTPFRMARFVETRIKETLQLSRPKKKSVTQSNPGTADNLATEAFGEGRHPAGISTYNHNPTKTMTYSQLRNILPTVTTIHTLGGRAELEIHNPAGGYLMAVNSNGNATQITEADWNNACVIRSRNPRSPWATKHYSGLSSFSSYGLNPAAALLRTIEEGDLFGLDDLEAA